MQPAADTSVVVIEHAPDNRAETAYYLYRPSIPRAVNLFSGPIMISPSSRTANFHYAIRNIVSAAEAQERGGHRVVYLNIGDPQAYGFRPPAHIVEAVARALRDDFTGYAHSAGLPDAREAVAAYATGLGVKTGPEQVLMTSGASEAADLILTALVEEGDEVLLPAPGYPLYPAILKKLGAVARFYNLDAAHAWQPLTDEVASLINQRTRALVLINPNNPTGMIIPDETTKELLELAARHELLVIADEVYRELCFGKQPTPASLFAAEMGVPLFTLESLSKTHLVPGWRVGWIRYTCGNKMPDLIRSICRLASGRLCSPTPAQYAVRPALEGDRSFLELFMREIKRRRDFAAASVRSIKRLSCELPEAAFYMMIKADDPQARMDEKFVLDLLEATGVLVVHGSGFDADPRQGFFRLVYLADEEILGTVFQKIGHFLEA
ncbi:MAG TPA: aminotransferase class I/II-fold pyridoxal phosphate-dependent enzyme [Pyrinomonadaceae bacterium]|jgi:aspartate/methionine/tyrosine aminotransferase|nr:aminotransferase class I/II-fold pyridoxal phosphate-dependent enzyme [Pyrinomonadaceae bacterium]